MPEKNPEQNPEPPKPKLDVAGARAIADAIAKKSNRQWRMEEQSRFLAIVAHKFGLPKDQIGPMESLLATAKEGFSNTSQHLQAISKRLGWESKAAVEKAAIDDILKEI